VNTIRILGTVLAALLGLAFGSFLNVCLSRWPEGESVVRPRSHCRNCGRTLAWWENIPVASWLALRARCRTCHEKISWRYPLVEVAVGVLWVYTAWQSLEFASLPIEQTSLDIVLIHALGMAVFYWMLVALAILDAENLWLPNWITFPGIALGFVLTIFLGPLDNSWWSQNSVTLRRAALNDLVAIAASAALILLIRWTYWLVRRREGIGLGDAKLMAMLGAWLGLSGALLSFAIGVTLGAIFALIALAVPTARRESKTWLAAKLPLGTFLCIGGIISALWGQPIISAYLRWAGF
jgi:leader peptidase (prepilin peptidase) / N-methyltransferase